MRTGMVSHNLPAQLRRPGVALGAGGYLTILGLIRPLFVRKPQA